VKILIICEKCGHFVELVPVTKGQHVHLNDNDERFRISEIELDYDYSVDEIEEVTAEVKEIRFDCKSCGDYIVLDEFPRHVYR
jgi:hypothetical protein